MFSFSCTVVRPANSLQNLIRLYSLRALNFSQFVPKHEDVSQKDIELLQNFLMSKPNTLVLTGAGISTESGIPDYRSEGVGLYARSDSRPVQHMEFVKNESIRRRYWARNFIGWPRFSAVAPNQTHYALARFEREDRIQGVVTQNVDRLHGKAGSKNVIELHGNACSVKCLSCEYEISRHDFQNILVTLNGQLGTTVDMIRPDGDVDIPQEFIDNFQVPSCPDCSGNLKPDITFFGDSVPKERVEAISHMVYDSDALLVLGSSLMVFSGYRLLLQARDLEIPIVIVNIGTTRGDNLAHLKISARCGAVIPKLFSFR